MIELTGISNEPRQRHLLNVLGSSTQAALLLEYRPDQFAWFYSVEWGDFAINNCRLVVDFNVLRQYSRVIPFGVACSASDANDPLFVDSFSTGVAKLYLLDTADIADQGIYAGGS